RLAHIFGGFKHPAAARELFWRHVGQAHTFDPTRRVGDPERAAVGSLHAPVVQRMLRLDPLGFAEHRATLAGGLQPVDATYLPAELLILRLGVQSDKVSEDP